jgi:hypothetical protein
MGFIEETGAAQHYRDARIAPIYEGTNGIQAADLVGRKLGLDGGAVLARLLADIRAGGDGHSGLHLLAGACEDAAGRLTGSGPDDRLAGSYPFLTMLSVATCGWLMTRSLAALEAGGTTPLFAEMKRAACRFYLERIVPEALGLAPGATGGAELLYSVSGEAFAA